MLAGSIRYRAAAALAFLLAVYVTAFARQTHHIFDLPTFIDLTEWPATLFYLAAAWAAFRRLPRRAALYLVSAMLAFFAAQSAWMFKVPLGFIMVAAASLGFLFILPAKWEKR
ncbi:MAG: hypothetical protein HKO04_04780 [Silicimonas sp.]|nr:hypothetical protein [Silicimonas sp.]